MSIWRKLVSMGKKPQRNIHLGRNDPCWCGSGKKYKKCHMEADAVHRSEELAKTCSRKG